MDLIVRLRRRGVPFARVLDALTASGLQPAHGGEWRFSTVQRIAERRGLHAPRTAIGDLFARRIEHGPGGCLIWTGRRHADGYGLFEADGKNVLAHRFAWQLKHGAIPPGVQLHHVCRTRACVKVSHLLPIEPSQHKAIEREENTVIEGIRSGAFAAEIATAPRPVDGEHALNDLGALRSTQAQEFGA